MTTERNAQGVDGLFRELLDENRASNKLSLTPKGRRINEARVAVAELIAADKEYDEARELVRFCAQPQPRYPAQVLNERHPAMLRMAAAADRRAAALAKFPEPRP